MSDNKKVKVHKYISGVNYPATRQDLIDMAKDNSAPAEVSDVLNNIAEREYGGIEDVEKEIGKLA